MGDITNSAPKGGNIESGFYAEGVRLQGLDYED